MGEGEPTAFEVVGLVHGEALSQQNAHWLLSQTLGYLTHLETIGEVQPHRGRDRALDGIIG